MTKCLLIDEDSAERQRLQQLLGLLGVDTASTSGAEDALKYCNDNRPDIVMLSADRAGGKPGDLVRKLRRSNRNRPPVVILYTETPDTDMIGQSILDGAADVLMKPFDRDILQFKLKQAGVIA